MVPGFEILLDCHNKHTLKSPHELRDNNEDEERGAAPSKSDDKSDSSSDSSSNGSGHDDDDNSRRYDSSYSGDDWGEPPSDGEDEGADLFYEEYDSDVDYYDEDIDCIRVHHSKTTMVNPIREDV
ncbi:hypothetical protein SO802_028899 [Lithocarpus litseifolius]|uniref:Uncharacterized protein n=1 Tax=Lithocarpus litseifolius TaxID=425828 RepID=A0AAW2BUT1_9ROSI